MGGASESAGRVVLVTNQARFRPSATKLTSRRRFWSPVLKHRARGEPWNEVALQPRPPCLRIFSEEAERTNNYHWRGR